MKIAIFHNLRNGGGIEYIKSIITELHRKNIDVDVYTHQEIQLKNTNKTYYYPLKKTSNIFKHVKQVLIETDYIEKIIANKIKSQNYDYIFVFPCHLQQCPNIINHLPINKTYYFYFESLREYYEQTSFDYYSINKIISRIIRFPIKIQDYLNCSKIQNIISNSYYSNYILSKIYNKTSNVIYPGMIRTYPKKHTIISNHQSLSFGQLSMLKGHHISAIINPNINIYGPKSHEYIYRYITANAIIHDDIIYDKNKVSLYKKNTFFFANQINEPFGITTLEATQNDCYVIGRNESGTCEIISQGINGSLYDIDDIKLSKNVFKDINSKTKIIIYKIDKIDWTETINKIINIITYV